MKNRYQVYGYDRNGKNTLLCTLSCKSLRDAMEKAIMRYGSLYVTGVKLEQVYE